MNQPYFEIEAKERGIEIPDFGMLEHIPLEGFDTVGALWYHLCRLGIKEEAMNHDDLDAKQTTWEALTKQEQLGLMLQIFIDEGWFDRLPYGRDYNMVEAALGEEEK